MKKSNKIRKEVYNRIIFAKALLQAAETACANRNDQMVFAKGILLLHDAVEAVLGAVADYLHVLLTGNRFILQYYALIKEADPEHRTVLYRTQMRNLNTLRNDLKHQGIFPDVKSNAHFPITVRALIEDTCQRYLGLDLSSVSLKSLIKNTTVLDFIEQAEKQIKDPKKIGEALISLAYAMYHICETSTISTLAGLLGRTKGKTPLQFTKPYELSHQVQLIQHGVDPYTYYRFKNLTPKIGKNIETGKLFYQWDKTYGHPKNWTGQNATFCLNFCIDTALKFQRDEDEKYTLVPYVRVYRDIIQPAKEEAIIWNESLHPPKYPTLFPPEPRVAIRTLKKGEFISGVAEDLENCLDEWYIMSTDLSPEPDKYPRLGFVLKKDVKITREEI